MKFDLRRPCPDCPFTTTCLSGWLGRARAQEIADAVSREDKTFACHKTTRSGGSRKARANEQQCAGAAIMVEKTGTANAMLQIAERFGLSDPARLDLGAPVFDSFAAFVDHHGAR